MIIAIVALAVLILGIGIYLGLRLAVMQREVLESHRKFESLEKGQDRSDQTLRQEMSCNREELRKSMTDMTQHNEQKLEQIRGAVERQLAFLQEDNSRKLELMRATVDEKLHATLEKRLGDSFQIVSERLEKVHQGLGEMQNLASGVGDLKKVLSNVKTRGILAELQLEALLEQILTSEQYAKNVITKRSTNDRVEFAIRLPGRGEDPVYLPIDAKFPQEDFERLQLAQEKGDPLEVESCAKALEARMKLEAKKIRDKYIDPPYTTDFAFLFLSTEGLYCEVLRRPGLFWHLQNEYKITVIGPTTCSAILTSFQMGFRTLAVEQRASEVWETLNSVKAEFSKFGDILEKTNDKLRQASETITQATAKSRNIEHKLRDVQSVPVDSKKILNQTSHDASIV